MRTVRLVSIGVAAYATLALGAGSWQGGTDMVGLGTPRPGTVRVAQNASGRAVAVWIETVAAVDRAVAARFDGTAWSAAEAIDGAPGLAASTPEVAIGPDGKALAVYVLDGVTNEVHAARFDGAAWLAPTRIDDVTDANDPGPPHVACGLAGKAVAVWSEGPRVFARTFDGAAWSNLWFLAAQGAERRTAVAMDATNTAVALWSQNDGSRQRMQAARYDGAAWSATTPIDTAAVFESSAPSVGMSGTGGAVAVWVHNPGGAMRAKAASFTPAGGWKAATYIDVEPPTGGYDASLPVIAVGPGDRAIAAFLKTDAKTRCWAARFDGSKWTTAKAIDFGGPSLAPIAAVGLDGNGFAGYTDQSATAALASRFEAGAFGSPAIVAGGLAGVAWGARIAAGPAGRGVAVFDRVDLSVAHVTTSVFGSSGAAPPAPLVVKVASAFGVGDPVTIKGKNFGATAGPVVVGDVAATVTKWTKSKITVVLPAGAGGADLVLTTADGLTATTPIVYAAPSLASVKVGKAKAGVSLVTLKGAAFGSVAHGETSVVLVGAAAHGAGDAAVVSWTDKAIKLRLALNPGTTSFSVRTSAGTSDAVEFTAP